MPGGLDLEYTSWRDTLTTIGLPSLVWVTHTRCLETERLAFQYIFNASCGCQVVLVFLAHIWDLRKKYAESFEGVEGDSGVADAESHATMANALRADGNRRSWKHWLEKEWGRHVTTLDFAASFLSVIIYV